MMKRKYIIRLLWFVVFVAVIFFIVRWIFDQIPKGEDMSRAFPIQGQEHIPVGSEHPPYNSNPPTSGWHYAKEANIGFYEKELPEEQLVHNLEHGHIWIAYHPTLPKKIISDLKKFAGFMTIVVPRSKNETDIALVSWGRLDTFDIENEILDTQRIKDFVLRYANHGPEKIVGMPR